MILDEQDSLDRASWFRSAAPGRASDLIAWSTRSYGDHPIAVGRPEVVVENLVHDAGGREDGRGGMDLIELPWAPSPDRWWHARTRAIRLFHDSSRLYKRVQTDGRGPGRRITQPDEAGRDVKILLQVVRAYKGMRPAGVPIP